MYLFLWGLGTQRHLLAASASDTFFFTERGVASVAVFVAFFCLVFDSVGGVGFSVVSSSWSLGETRVTEPSAQRNAPLEADDHVYSRSLSRGRLLATRHTRDILLYSR